MSGSQIVLKMHYICRNNQKEKCVEIAYSELSQKENEILVHEINGNWDFINEQISKSFNGQKTIVKKLK